MKPTKTLVRYIWLYDWENKYHITNLFFGECSTFGQFGIAFVIIGLIIFIPFIGCDNNGKVIGAIGFILACIGGIICLIDAIRRVIVGKKEAKRMIEEASFEIDFKKDDLRYLVSIYGLSFKEQE